MLKKKSNLQKYKILFSYFIHIIFLKPIYTPWYTKSDKAISLQYIISTSIQLLNYNNNAHKFLKYDKYQNIFQKKQNNIHNKHNKQSSYNYCYYLFYLLSLHHFTAKQNLFIKYIFIKCLLIAKIA